MVSDNSSEEVRNENLTEASIVAYKSAGYSVAFIENVMRYDLTKPLPRSVPTNEITYLEWTLERVHNFYTVYQGSFRERPGFPGWNEAEWAHWTASDPLFHAELSFLAMIGKQVAGFVTNAEDDEPEKHGYIIQLGVLPEWREQGIGGALIVHSLQKWRDAGKEAVILHVNTNNPDAIRLYQQLGFVVIKQRGKFVRLQK